MNAVFNLTVLYCSSWWIV